MTQKMNLVIFDIDGTLVQSSLLDERCFQTALTTEFAYSGIDPIWSNYTHVTDSCIFQEAFFKHAGRLPHPQEIERFQNRFFTLLQKAWDLDQNQFLEVQGARAIFDTLQRSPSWKISIATGGWKASACLKLRKMGLNPNLFPSAFADDGLSREEIVTLSIKRAQIHEGIPHFDTLVYVGDGIWDAQTCKNLNIPFIGISTKHSPQKLIQEGAIRVFSNFLNSLNFLAALEEIQAQRSLQQNVKSFT